MEASVSHHHDHRERQPLIDGRYMTCPRCKEKRDILAFIRFGEVEEFAADTAPIYKCPKPAGGCGWIFAPAEHTILFAMHPVEGGDGKVRYE